MFCQLRERKCFLQARLSGNVEHALPKCLRQSNADLQAGMSKQVGPANLDLQLSVGWKLRSDPKESITVRLIWGVVQWYHETGSINQIARRPRTSAADRYFQEPFGTGLSIPKFSFPTIIA
jgi:hypothetical protein